MTIKELLNSHYEVNLVINSKLEQLEELKSLATKVSTSDYSESRPIGTYTDRVGRVTARIIDLENEINDEIDRLVSVKLKISEILSVISNKTQRTILERHYILNESWEKVADKIGYSARHVTRLHNAAIEKLEKIYPEGL